MKFDLNNGTLKERLAEAEKQVKLLRTNVEKSQTRWGYFSEITTDAESDLQDALRRVRALKQAIEKEAK